MSAYIAVETEFRDLEALVEALKECCEVRSQRSWSNAIEVHKTPQNLYGYANDKRVERAEVIIRKADVGRASNDIGFVKTANGTYQAVISSFDKNVGYNKEWLTQLKKKYSEKKVTRKAQKMGYSIKKQEIDGKIRLTLTK
jgi:hypothetical protein